LIDTGQRHARKQILADTKDLKVDQIFVTHHHEDHSGNIAQLQAQYRCEVYGSKACSEMMKNPPKISLAQKLTWGSRPAFGSIVPLENELKTPKYTFQIVPIPGHASDMVALYEPSKKWLFSADLYINSYISYFLENESIADQIDSIRRVMNLDFDVMFCSHKPKLENPKDSLAKKLDFLSSTFDAVGDLHARGHSAKSIFKLLKLKEDHVVKTLSSGLLSKLNMVKSIIRDIENKPGLKF
jgi:glyoxylase-like metal-dependent hydrolase (beta-lactamase superfamily II)